MTTKDGVILGMIEPLSGSDQLNYPFILLFELIHNKGFDMAVPIQQHDLTLIMRESSKYMRALLIGSALVSALTLTACQTAPSNQTVSSSNTGAITSSAPVTQTPKSDRNQRNNASKRDGYPSETPATDTTTMPVYPSSSEMQTMPSSEGNVGSTNPLTRQTPVRQQPEVIFNEPVYTPPREDYRITQPSNAPSHSDLLEQARQNSQQQSRTPTNDQSNLPAFRSLMQTGTSQLKAGNLTAAENSFTRAQRLAPRSSAVYFYLSQVALKKNQPRKAEAMARRGLTVSQDTSSRRALWQLILSSGQQQNNPRVIQEAKLALK